MVMMVMAGTGDVMVVKVVMMVLGGDNDDA